MKNVYIIRFSETIHYLATIQAEGPQTAIDAARRQFCDGDLLEESVNLSHSIVSEIVQPTTQT